MDYIVVGLVILIILFVYILYTYFYATKTTIMSTANLNVGNPAITNIPQPQNANYAYGVWIYVNNLNSTGNVIFSRANNIVLYLDKNSPTLYCDIQTKDASKTTATMITNNFPVQKWCYIIVSVDGQFIDYYINGKLVKSEKKVDAIAIPHDATAAPINLGNSGSPAPKQYGTISAGAFDAYLSKFQRWTNPIDPQTAWTSYLAGNGQSTFSLSQYNANVTILKNQVQQSQYSLF